MGLERGREGRQRETRRKKQRAVPAERDCCFCCVLSLGLPPVRMRQMQREALGNYRGEPPSEHMCLPHARLHKILGGQSGLRPPTVSKWPPLPPWPSQVTGPTGRLPPRPLSSGVQPLPSLLFNRCPRTPLYESPAPANP